MYLRELEDYIVSLAARSLDSSGEFIHTSEVVERLMVIIVDEEKRIPDFIIDGNSQLSTNGMMLEKNEFKNDYFLELDADDDSLSINETRWLGGVMKKLLWLMFTAAISGICFLIGFFIAP